MNAEEFAALSENRLAAAKAKLQTLLDASGPRREDNTLQPLNDLTAILDAVSSQSSLLQSVSPDAAMRAAAEKTEQEASKLSTVLALHRGLFDALNAVDIASLAPDARRLVEHTLRDMRRAGVDKDEATRSRITALNEAQTKNSQAFERNIREDVRHTAVNSLAGLPADYVERHKDKSISSDYPDYVPFMTYADDAEARHALYRAFRERGHPKNLSVLGDILSVRRELASVLGYKDWADYITETRMIGSGARVGEFIERVAGIAKPAADREIAELLTYKKASVFNEWDRAYYEEKVKRDRFAISAQDVRQYFEYARTKEGVLATCADLFSVRFERVNESAWHEEVETYDVYDGKTRLGRFQLDMHPRDGKYKHAAQFTWQRGCDTGGEHIVPMGVLVCNFPRAGELLEHHDVVTFFHEFGHLLHHIFGGGQRFVQFSGVATEWDFVEAPSQLLEEWAFDADVLARFARHQTSGEPMPKELATRLKAADEFGKGIQARVQMFYAALSLQLYQRSPVNLDSTAVVEELQNRYSPFRYEKGTHFHCSFGHLDGYSAGYYTYMWSLLIAKDLASGFERGHMDAAAAKKYRSAVLAPGGVRDAAVLCRDFLGRDYNEKAFEAWLNRPAEVQGAA